VQRLNCHHWQVELCIQREVLSSSVIGFHSAIPLRRGLDTLAVTARSASASSTRADVGKIPPQKLLGADALFKLGILIDP
jgi:hypothetical protein